MYTSGNFRSDSDNVVINEEKEKRKKELKNKVFSDDVSRSYFSINYFAVFIVFLSFFLAIFLRFWFIIFSVLGIFYIYYIYKENETIKNINQDLDLGASIIRDYYLGLEIKLERFNAAYFGGWDSEELRRIGVELGFIENENKLNSIFF